MRRSSLHHSSAAPSEPGLAEYLAGNATLDGIMQRAKPDAKRCLAALTASPRSPSSAPASDSDKAADLSGNHRFDELIATSRPQFDWIVVDSSPVNLVADGVNLARACDGVLLVARGGVTKFEVAQRALTDSKPPRSSVSCSTPWKTRR